MLDLVGSSGEVADCNQMNTLHLPLPFQVCRRPTVAAKHPQNAKGPPCQRQWHAENEKNPTTKQTNTQTNKTKNTLKNYSRFLVIIVSSYLI